MAVKPVKTPFTNMSFTPDIPSAALSPSEYNIGHNVETDVRGINSVLGDEQILNAIPGNVIFTTAGFRNNDIYWFVVATREGKWYGLSTSGITELTPADANYVNTYNDAMPITDSWSGTTLIINDNINPPMFLTADAARFTLYNNDYPATTLNWNYNPDWTRLRAGFCRLYASPNVGSLLIAGNLQADTTGNTVVNLPTTVRWSQNFGTNYVPLTWVPTITNTANELEVPVRGPVIDGFPMNGNFYVCSYWDTVVFSPIAYTSTSAPVFGVRLINVGRGLLNENCWANADNTVYGLDARDIWVFDGNDFKGIGNQRVRNWFFDQITPQYYDRIHMQTNTQKSQIEIYYPDKDAFNGIPNRMLSYRYDLDVWNPPCFVAEASFACESPVFIGSTATVNNVSGTNVTGTGAGATFDISYSGATYSAVVHTAGSGYAVGDQILISGVSMGGTTPANDVLLTVTSGPGASGTGVATVVAEGRSPATYTPNFASRTITYIRGTHSGVPDPHYFGNYEGILVQKDLGYSFMNNSYIFSTFERDNMRLSKDYTNKVMVHRMLPEIVNLDTTGVPLYPGPGALDITLKGSNSVGSIPDSKNTVTVPVNSTGDTNADSPWAQFDQNAYRVNSIELSYGSDTTTWMCNAITVQLTVVEDDR